MRVPLSWLRELAPIDETVTLDDLVERLHFLGLLVEDVRRPVELPGVVVAEVRECREIPGARSVQLVVVDDGEGSREVVCGAFNFGPGDRVPLARPGAVLPGGMRIDSRTIKSLGVTSHGMLCAPEEIGAGDDRSDARRGILVLDRGLPLGGPVAPLLGLDEAVIELEVTPNRPDCMAMLGVAREVAAAYGVPLQRPDATVATAGPATADLVTVDVEDPAGCDRYVAMVIEGVRVGPSPEWVCRRLRAAGMRPVNNVVDVTNYVLWELGQPLHAFDLDRLAGRRILVRRAREGETTVTLDDVERRLRPADLLICDGDGPVAIAGVMGGASSEVSEGTTRVLLESAHFHPPSVLHTAKRLGLRTESSARFERGTDPGACDVAAARAARLISEIAGGEVRPRPLDTCPGGPEPGRIAMRPARVNRLLGTDLSGGRMCELLVGVGIEELAAGGDARSFRVPTWRPDLEREADLAEEVARLHGYNDVPRTLPAAGAEVGVLSPHQAAEAALRATLLAAGADEACTLSFVSDADYAPLGWTGVPRVELANPLREEERYLRTSLVPTLLRAVAHNVARRARTVALWEIGAVFFPAGGAASGEVDERRRLAVVLAGEDDTPAVHAGRRRRLDVYDAKGILESLAASPPRDLTIDPAADVPPGLHPGRSGGVLLGGEPVGWLGELHPDAAGALDLTPPPVAFELDLQTLLDARAARDDRYEEPSPYPASYYDLAFVVDEGVRAGDLTAALASAGAPLCRAVAAFDVFRGDKIGGGVKSVAFEARFQADDRTLTDAEVAEAVARMVAAAQGRFGARLRSG